MHDFEVAAPAYTAALPRFHGQTSRIIDEDVPYARKPGSRSRPGEEVSIRFEFPSNLHVQGIHAREGTIFYARTGRYDRR